MLRVKFRTWVKYYNRDLPGVQYLRTEFITFIGSLLPEDKVLKFSFFFYTYRFRFRYRSIAAAGFQYFQ